MRNPDPFEPLLISRYTVIRVHVEYWEPPEEKFFIVLCQRKGTKHRFCICLKPSSQHDWYERQPQRFLGTVRYSPGVLPFFYEGTVIDPGTVHEIPHEYFSRQSAKRRYKIEGHMPEDFHRKLVQAINEHYVMSAKEKLERLELIGEAAPEKRSATSD